MRAEIVVLSSLDVSGERPSVEIRGLASPSLFVTARAASDVIVTSGSPLRSSSLFLRTSVGASVGGWIREVLHDWFLML
jgi:hypothetical protein